MSTTSGNMNTLKVTGKDGNVFVMTPVDTEARQAIDEAKNLQFDDNYFTAEVSQDQSTVSVGLNGVPIGVSSPLRFDQDTAQGIVIGIDTSAVTPAEMTGATASTDGESGLVPAPEAGDEDKYLKGDGTWTDVPLEKSTYGTYVSSEQGEAVQGEGGEIAVSENSVELYDTFKGVKFGAARAVADREGNVIDETYATKEIVDGIESALATINDTMETVAHGGMYDLGTKTESNLSNGKLAIGCGNSTTELTLTTVNALTVLANPGVANFALLVDNTRNSNAVTVTVKDSADANTFYQSTDAGNTIGAGKICQVTCVGKCWTLAEFEAPA